MSTKQKFDQGFLESHGLSPVVASLIIVEFDALRDERDTAIAAAKDKHSVRAGINSDLKSELERVQKQAAAMRKALASIAEDKALVAFGHNANPMASRLGGVAAAALKPDAGRDYVHKDRLVDALKSIETISEALAMEKKQAAALREALVRLCNSWAEGSERENYEAMKEAKAAISSDAGRDFINREQVKPLVDGLKEFLSWLESEGFKTKPADDALEHARKLGL